MVKEKHFSYPVRKIELPAKLRGFRTVKEEAVRLNVKRQTIYHRLRTGRYYEAVFVGGHTLLRPFIFKSPLSYRGRKPRMIDA